MMLRAVHYVAIVNTVHGVQKVSVNGRAVMQYQIGTDGAIEARMPPTAVAGCGPVLRLATAVEFLVRQLVCCRWAHR